MPQAVGEGNKLENGEEQTGRQKSQMAKKCEST